MSCVRPPLVSRLVSSSPPRSRRPRSPSEDSREPPSERQLPGAEELPSLLNVFDRESAPGIDSPNTQLSRPQHHLTAWRVSSASGRSPRTDHSSHSRPSGAASRRSTPRTPAVGPLPPIPSIPPPDLSPTARRPGHRSSSSIAVRRGSQPSQSSVRSSTSSLRTAWPCCAPSPGCILACACACACASASASMGARLAPATSPPRLCTRSAACACASAPYSRSQSHRRRRCALGDAVGSTGSQLAACLVPAAASWLEGREPAGG